MSKISIIVEGKSDRKFLIDLIKVTYNINLESSDFIVVGGNSDKLHIVQNDIKSRIESGISVLLIFDADQSDYDSTIRGLGEKKQELDLTFDTFLFPNNHDTGNLETLLRTIINPINEPLFGCIENYSDCLNNLSVKNIRTFNSKAKIYIYVDSCLSGGSANVELRDYTSTELWDLKSTNLNPLIFFLSKYFES